MSIQNCVLCPLWSLKFEFWGNLMQNCAARSGRHWIFNAALILQVLSRSLPFETSKQFGRHFSFFPSFFSETPPFKWCKGTLLQDSPRHPKPSGSFEGFIANLGVFEKFRFRTVVFALDRICKQLVNLFALASSKIHSLFWNRNFVRPFSEKESVQKFLFLENCFGSKEETEFPTQLQLLKLKTHLKNHQLPKRGMLRRWQKVKIWSGEKESAWAPSPPTEEEGGAASDCPRR